jgi:hypothetical protein
MISETPHIFDCPICGMVWSVTAEFSPRSDDGVIHVYPVVTQLCDCEGDDE